MRLRSILSIALLSLLLLPLAASGAAQTVRSPGAA